MPAKRDHVEDTHERPYGDGPAMTAELVGASQTAFLPKSSGLFIRCEPRLATLQSVADTSYIGPLLGREQTVTLVVGGLFK